MKHYLLGLAILFVLSFVSGEIFDMNKKLDTIIDIMKVEQTRGE